MKRADNFNAGPAALPLPVLERMQRELLDYRGTGMSVMELSHRSAAYEAIQQEAEVRLRRLLGLSDAYRVLFLQGGASLQFSMLPMNFLSPEGGAAYILTGSWAEKACEEAVRFGPVKTDTQAKVGGYRDVPQTMDEALVSGVSYVHMTTNNTLFGTQWYDFPDIDAPLVADMSSDILARPIPVEKFAMIYAGAQKNLGPSGLTVVIVRDDFLATAKTDVPTMLRYQTHANASSLYNTPPTFAIYVMALVLEWLEEQGGLTAMAKRNREKASLIYQVMDEYPELFQGHAVERARSDMNVTFRLADDVRSKTFLDDAALAGFVGVKGHRSVGGCRVSLYNAVPVESAARFADFMRDFARQHR